MKALLYDRSYVDEEGDTMERIVKSVIWLLMAFMFGIAIGMYYGGVAANQQIREQMVLKDQFVMQRFSQ